jgi:hypothetical protein
VYMKKTETSLETGVGDGWFKIFDEGYDNNSRQWCTDKLIESQGLMTVKLPQGLIGGYYIIRTEILALHNPEPQFFVGCSQIFLQSTGSAVPERTVSIPGYIQAGDPALPSKFKLYNQNGRISYPVPGPAVARFKNTGRTTQTRQSEGLRFKAGVLEAGNWVGQEVNDYNNDAECSKAFDFCNVQLLLCNSGANIIYSDACTIWERKCADIANTCKTHRYPGPPNKGKDLTPPHARISIPAPLGRNLAAHRRRNIAL